jgi:hypothetical protein
VQKTVTQPEGFDLPSLADLETALPGLISACADGLGKVLTVSFEK